MIIILGHVAEIARLEWLQSHFDWQQWHSICMRLNRQAVDLVRVEASDVLGHGQGHRLVVELHAY